MRGCFRILLLFLLCVALIVAALGYLWKIDLLPDPEEALDYLEELLDELDLLRDQAGSDTVLAPSQDSEEFPKYDLEQAVNAEVEEYLCKAYLEHCEVIDLSGFSISPKELFAINSYLCISHPELFFLSGSLNYSYSKGLVTEVRPEYRYDKATTEQMLVKYEAYIDEIADGAPDGSELERLLYLHDYFLLNYTYDDTYTIRDAYTFFEQKTGVCQAYMLALIAAADALGIESIPVTSNEMRHSWNMVKLEGSWYHVDLTWDDVGTASTLVSYRYFLRSDASIAAIDAQREERHRDWSCVERAGSTVYDDAIWHGSVTPILTLNGSFYCTVGEVSRSDKVVHSIYGGSDLLSMTHLTSIDTVWPANESQQHVSCYATLIAVNGGILYNTSDTLRFYNLSTGIDRALKIPLWLGADMSVYGIVGLEPDGTLCYLVGPYDMSDGFVERYCTIP